MTVIKNAKKNYWKVNYSLSKDQLTKPESYLSEAKIKLNFPSKAQVIRLTKSLRARKKGSSKFMPNTLKQAVLGPASITKCSKSGARTTSLRNTRKDSQRIFNLFNPKVDYEKSSSIVEDRRRKNFSQFNIQKFNERVSKEHLKSIEEDTYFQPDEDKKLPELTFNHPSSFQTRKSINIKRRSTIKRRHSQLGIL